MAFLKVSLTVAVILFVTLESSLAYNRAAEIKKRSVGLEPKNKNQEPAWKPATGPREFTVDVDDNIEGANQHRHETWNNGTVVGSYAAPGRNGKWLKYEYIGDSQGFRITSTKELTPEELNAGRTAAKAHQANINIQSDNNPNTVHYTVTEDQLNANKANQSSAAQQKDKTTK